MNNEDVEYVTLADVINFAEEASKEEGKEHYEDMLKKALKEAWESMGDSDCNEE